MTSQRKSEVRAGHDRGCRTGEIPMIEVSVRGIRFMLHFFVFRFFLVSAVPAGKVRVENDEK